MTKRIMTVALVCVLAAPVVLHAQVASDIVPRRITLPNEHLAKEAYLTVPKGKWVAALSYEYEFLNHAFEGEKEDVNSERTVTLNNTLAFDVSYGVSENITLNAIIPYKYVYNTREIDSALVAGTPGIIFSDRRGSQGLGDVILMSYLRIKFGDIIRFGDEYYPTGDDGYDEYIRRGPDTYAGRRQGASFALALGLRLPTGSTTQLNENGNRLPNELQLGTGTLDPILGLLYHQRHFRLGWGVSGLYRFSPSENIHHWAPGEEIVASAYLSYRLSRNLEWVNQLNGDYLGKSQSMGQTVENSGGSVLFYTPSLVYVGAKNFTLQVSGEVPIYRNFNTVQLSSNYVINLRTAFVFD
ncbi:MAG: hypothetical protein GF341_02275 [candidate division Zixibacteria bacterium]|nr:hypothetical protein [candidate division Zixibacteria bacterium]